MTRDPYSHTPHNTKYPARSSRSMASNPLDLSSYPRMSSWKLCVNTSSRVCPNTSSRSLERVSDPELLWPGSCGSKFRCSDSGRFDPVQLWYLFCWVGFLGIFCNFVRQPLRCQIWSPQCHICRIPCRIVFGNGRREYLDNPRNCTGRTRIDPTRIGGPPPGGFVGRRCSWRWCHEQWIHLRQQLQYQTKRFKLKKKKLFI